jgi:hypothetical protein
MLIHIRKGKYLKDSFRNQSSLGKSEVAIVAHLWNVYFHVRGLKSHS